MSISGPENLFWRDGVETVKPGKLGKLREKLGGKEMGTKAGQVKDND